MMMAPVSMQSSRERVIDFVPVPFFYDYTTVLLKQPDPNARKWRTLLEPFQPTVFILLTVSLLGVTIVLCLVERYTAYYKADERRLCFNDVFLYLVGVWFLEGIALLFFL